MRNMGMFSVSHIPSTLYFMFLQPPTLNKTRPYLHPMPSLPSWLSRPPGFLLERVTGLFVSTPFLWVLFFAVGAALFRRSAVGRSFPKLETVFAGAFIGLVVLILSAGGGTMRYLADFATCLDLAAIVAWFYVDQRFAERPGARVVWRGAGALLIVVSAIIGITLGQLPSHYYMDG